MARAARITDALVDMAAEAQRAYDKHGELNTMDAPTRDDGFRLAILVEEVGEVAKELTYDHQDEGQPDRLRQELIQVGAMAATWAAML